MAEGQWFMVAEDSKAIRVKEESKTFSSLIIPELDNESITNSKFYYLWEVHTP